jgi:FkbM family methyltransferase
MMDRFGATCYGVDPTRKHRAALQTLVQRNTGLFHYLPYAVAATSGTLQFSESDVNVSGSLFDDHVNIRCGSTTTYQIQSVTLRDLVSLIGVERIDFLKLDLEGAEYELVEGANIHDFMAYEQLFIEFHHHAVARFSIADTQKAVQRIVALGYQSFSLDDQNYLFYRR